MKSASCALDYLDHILKAIERIDRYTIELNEDDFLASELVQDAVLRNIEIIGEASNNILRNAPEYARQHAHVPWLVLYTMRNRVAHGYDKVDLEITWKTVKVDLPGLREAISQLRTDFPTKSHER